MEWPAELLSQVTESHVGLLPLLYGVKFGDSVSRTAAQLIVTTLTCCILCPHSHLIGNLYRRRKQRPGGEGQQLVVQEDSELCG